MKIYIYIILSLSILFIINNEAKAQSGCRFVYNKGTPDGLYDPYYTPTSDCFVCAPRYLKVVDAPPENFVVDDPCLKLSLEDCQKWSWYRKDLNQGVSCGLRENSSGQPDRCTSFYLHPRTGIKFTNHVPNMKVDPVLYWCHAGDAASMNKEIRRSIDFSKIYYGSAEQNAQFYDRRVSQYQLVGPYSPSSFNHAPNVHYSACHHPLWAGSLVKLTDGRLMCSISYNGMSEAIDSPENQKGPNQQICSSANITFTPLPNATITQNLNSFNYRNSLSTNVTPGFPNSVLLENPEPLKIYYGPKSVLGKHFSNSSITASWWTQEFEPWPAFDFPPDTNLTKDELTKLPVGFHVNSLVPLNAEEQQSIKTGEITKVSATSTFRHILSEEDSKYLEKFNPDEMACAGRFGNIAVVAPRMCGCPEQLLKMMKDYQSLAHLSVTSRLSTVCDNCNAGFEYKSILTDEMPQFGEFFANGYTEEKSIGKEIAACLMNENEVIRFPSADIAGGPEAIVTVPAFPNKNERKLAVLEYKYIREQLKNAKKNVEDRLLWIEDAIRLLGFSNPFMQDSPKGGLRFISEVTVVLKELYVLESLNNARRKFRAAFTILGSEERKAAESFFNTGSVTGGEVPVISPSGPNNATEALQVVLEEICGGIDPCGITGQDIRFPLRVFYQRIQSSIETTEARIRILLQKPYMDIFLREFTRSDFYRSLTVESPSDLELLNQVRVAMNDNLLDLRDSQRQLLEDYEKLESYLYCPGPDNRDIEPRLEALVAIMEPLISDIPKVSRPDGDPNSAAYKEAIKPYLREVEWNVAKSQIRNRRAQKDIREFVDDTIASTVTAIGLTVATVAVPGMAPEALAHGARLLSGANKLLKSKMSVTAAEALEAFESHRNWSKVAQFMYAGIQVGAAGASAWELKEAIWSCSYLVSRENVDFAKYADCTRKIQYLVASTYGVGISNWARKKGYRQIYSDQQIIELKLLETEVAQQTYTYSKDVNLEKFRPIIKDEVIGLGDDFASYKIYLKGAERQTGYLNYTITDSITDNSPAYKYVRGVHVYIDHTGGIPYNSMKQRIPGVATFLKNEIARKYPDKAIRGFLMDTNEERLLLAFKNNPFDPDLKTVPAFNLNRPFVLLPVFRDGTPHIFHYVQFPGNKFEWLNKEELLETPEFFKWVCKQTAFGSQ